MQALVIDSNPADHAAVVPRLHQAGYSTVGVTSIVDARQALGQQSFDLIILELWLPDGDGARLCHEIRERLGYQLVIIFVSAQDNPLNRAATLELGADDFIGKPFDGEELLIRVQALQRRLRISVDHTPAAPYPMA